MWGRKKKEELVIPTHLYIGMTPVKLTGRCAGDRVEVIKDISYGNILDWVEKKWLEPIYECPDHDKS